MKSHLAPLIGAAAAVAAKLAHAVAGGDTSDEDSILRRDVPFEATVEIELIEEGHATSAEIVLSNAPD